MFLIQYDFNVFSHNSSVLSTGYNEHGLYMKSFEELFELSNSNTTSIAQYNDEVGVIF
jgi:hypothetical protein